MSYWIKYSKSGEQIMSRGRMREITGIVTKNSSDKTVMIQTETKNK